MRSARHPLCRGVQFDIVSTPRTRKGGNWTISLQSVTPDALWEASDIVAEIQDAYDLRRLISPPPGRPLPLKFSAEAAAAARLSLNYDPVSGKLTVGRGRKWRTA